MRIGILVAAVALAAVSFPVCGYSDSTQSAETAQAPAPDQDQDQIICKSSPAKTGSRLGGGRECHSKREWDDREKQAQKATQEYQMRTLQGQPGGN